MLDTRVGIIRNSSLCENAIARCLSWQNSPKIKYGTGQKCWWIPAMINCTGDDDYFWQSAVPKPVSGWPILWPASIMVFGPTIEISKCHLTFVLCHYAFRWICFIILQQWIVSEFSAVFWSLLEEIEETSKASLISSASPQPPPHSVIVIIMVIVLW